MVKKKRKGKDGVRFGGDGCARVGSGGHSWFAITATYLMGLCGQGVQTVRSMDGNRKEMMVSTEIHEA